MSGTRGSAGAASLDLTGAVANEARVPWTLSGVGYAVASDMVPS